MTNKSSASAESKTGTKPSLGETGDAAEILQVSAGYVRYMADVGKLPTFAVTPKGRRIFDLEVVRLIALAERGSITPSETEALLGN